MYIFFHISYQNHRHNQQKLVTISEYKSNLSKHTRSCSSSVLLLHCCTVIIAKEYFQEDWIALENQKSIFGQPVNNLVMSFENNLKSIFDKVIKVLHLVWISNQKKFKS